MKPNHKKNVGLIKQYPFVRKILSKPIKLGMYLFPLGDKNAHRVDSLTINVEKADGDLLYRCAENVGIDEDSCLPATTTKRKDQVKKQGEYIFAIDANDEIINSVSWPKNKEERCDKQLPYAKRVLLKEHGGLLGSFNCIANQTRYLVWVTVEVWYEYSGDMITPFGKFIDRNIIITIFKKPECGFDELLGESNVRKNLRLDNGVMSYAFRNNDHDLIIVIGMLNELCLLFQDEVYHGMKNILEKNKQWHSACFKFGHCDVLVTKRLGGYKQIRLEDRFSYVVFEILWDERGLYIIGQGGTLPQIRNLVRSVVKSWSNLELRKNFQLDENV